MYSTIMLNIISYSLHFKIEDIIILFQTLIHGSLTDTSTLELEWISEIPRREHLQTSPVWSHAEILLNF